MREFAAYLALLQGLGHKPTDDVVIAGLGEKILRHWRAGALAGEWPFSLSRRPPACVQDSLGTPWGLHAVADKLGAGEPAGMVFRGRAATGRRWMDLADAGPDQPCMVTTRILRLRGLEPGLNAGPGVDSHERFIYIHGTNHPERFPENISSGCLLMRDGDLLELFDAIPAGAHVWIRRDPPAHQP